MKTTRLIFPLMLLTSGLGLAQVTFDYDKSAPFSSYKTYSWTAEGVAILPVDPSRPLVDLEALDQRIRTLVEEELKKKGYRKLSEGEPDFRINYLGVARLDLDVSTWDTGTSGTAPYGHWRPFANPCNDSRVRREGTLTLDVVDVKTGKLVWRGISKNTYNKAKDVKKVDKALKKLLKKFPPKK